MSENKATRTAAAQRAPPHLTQKQLEEEEARRIERNRAVFEAWLDKKREERKRERVLKLKALQLEQEQWEKSRGVGQMAFDRWLKKKQTENEAMKKERAKQAELARMDRERQVERRKRAEVAFDTWKQHKDVQQEMDQQLTSQQYSPPPRHPPTPPLAGYCSVWSCDQDMAKFFVGKVKRSGSFDLSDTFSYNQDDDYIPSHYHHHHTATS